ncbi:MAG: ribose 5-phosphate isomerase B [Firmicutes bacterium]|nr:ribose 5-phosphate isomerase B [Bacillota bacterium]
MSNKKIVLASDHAGFSLKEELRRYLEDKGYLLEDYGAFASEPVDYPDYALKAARAVAARKFQLGILICGTGIGMAIVANKIPGIRAACCQDCFSARAAREHNDANILTLGARVIGPGLAMMVVENFLEASFQGGRHQRRLEKISSIEKCSG